jgi:hypothetical protein
MLTLSRDEFKNLRTALLDAFPVPHRMNELVRTARQLPLPQIALGEDLQEVVEKVIRKAESEQWLLTLINAACELEPTHEGLKQFRDAWKVPAEVVTIDHQKLLFLPGKTVLINRKPLRDALAALEDSSGSRVLIVDGDPQSGKTYSVHYISFLSSARRTFRCAYIDLERVPRNPEKNKIEATNLGDAIGLALLARKYEDPSDYNQTTWLDRYCGWLERELPENPVFWLVIDNFVKVPLEESALDLVTELAMRTYRNLHSVRLVLLSYGDVNLLQSRVVGAVEYERIGPIDEMEIKRFFAQLFVDESRRRGEPLNNQALAPRVSASVRRVLAKVPPNGLRRLEVLCRTAWSEADSIIRPPSTVDEPVDALMEEVHRLDSGESPKEEG